MVGGDGLGGVTGGRGVAGGGVVAARGVASLFVAVGVEKESSAVPAASESELSLKTTLPQLGCGEKKSPAVEDSGEEDTSRSAKAVYSSSEP